MPDDTPRITQASSSIADAASDKMRLFAESWDAAAPGYDSYFVPRFAPWIEVLVRDVVARALPDGVLVVPCCGTGPEIAGLSAAFPERSILGVDLSPGMLDIAARRLTGASRVSLVVGDATAPSGAWASGCAAIVSAFGLQQMPDPLAALRAWGRALAPGGHLSVVLWPGDVEQDGPFAALRRVLVGRVGVPDTTWEQRLPAAVEEGDVHLESDLLLTFPMHHDDAATFWVAVNESGPLRSLAAARGATFMAEARADFLARMPSGPIAHAPTARWLAGRRRS